MKKELDQSKTTSEQVDALFRITDPGLVDDLAQAIARGCVAYDVRLPVGCLTAVTKSILYTLDQRRKNSDG